MTNDPTLLRTNTSEQCTVYCTSNEQRAARTYLETFYWNGQHSILTVEDEKRTNAFHIHQLFEISECAPAPQRSFIYHLGSISNKENTIAVTLSSSIWTKKPTNQWDSMKCYTAGSSVTKKFRLEHVYWHIKRDLQPTRSRWWRRLKTEGYRGIHCAKLWRWQLLQYFPKKNSTYLQQKTDSSNRCKTAQEHGSNKGKWQ